MLDLKAPLEREGVVAGTIVAPIEVDAEALAALVALGYSSGEARSALAAADVPEDAELETRVLAALKAMGAG